MPAKRVLSYIRKNLEIQIPYFLEFLSYAVLSIAIGIILSKLVEKPFLLFRDRFFPSRSGTFKNKSAHGEIKRTKKRRNGILRYVLMSNKRN